MHPVIRGNLASRTTRSGALLILLGTLQQLFPQFVDLIPDKYEGLALAIIGAVVVFLRNITGQPITDKGAKQ